MAHFQTGLAAARERVKQAIPPSSKFLGWLGFGVIGGYRGIQGLYRDNGKENGNYHLEFRV